MTILVIGCGRLGARLADQLDERGHDVVVLDQNPDAFRALHDNFSGNIVCGTALDMRVLSAVGVEGCDAVVAATSDDNLNITVSQLIKEQFGSVQVLARISDPTREKVFKKFGLKTVCPTNLAADTMFVSLTQPWAVEQVTFETATVTFSGYNDTERYVGKDISKIRLDDGSVILGILRKNGSMELAHSEKKMTIGTGDKLILARVSD